MEELCETANALLAPVRLGVARPTVSPLHNIMFWREIQTFPIPGALRPLLQRQLGRRLHRGALQRGARRAQAERRRGRRRGERQGQQGPNSIHFLIFAL